MKKKKIIPTNWIEDSSLSSDDSDFEDKNHEADQINLDIEIDNYFSNSSSAYYHECIDNVIDRYKNSSYTRSYDTRLREELNPDFNNAERMRIIEQMVIFSDKLNLSNETFFYALKIFDWLLCSISINKELLYVYFTTSLLIADKVECESNFDIYTRLCSDIDGLTADSLAEKELEILELLDYNTFFLTPMFFVGLFIQRFGRHCSNIIPSAYSLSRAMLCICLSDERFNLFDTFTLSAVVFNYALEICDTDLTNNISCIKEEESESCRNMVKTLIKSLIENNASMLSIFVTEKPEICRFFAE